MAEDNKEPTGAESEAVLSTLLAESPQLWSVVELFVRTLPEQIAAMQEALRAQSFEQLQTLAEQLRRQGEDHQIHPLAARASELERAAREHVLQTLGLKINELSDLINQIRTNLQNPPE